MIVPALEIDILLGDAIHHRELKFPVITP